MSITKKKKVIIIGAGIAGLAACKRLMAKEVDVEILEARDRPGGRITIDNTMGFPVSCGASWIHGDQDNPMTELAKQYQVKMAPIQVDKFARFDQAGDPIAQPDLMAFEKAFQKLAEDARQLAFAAETDMSLSEAILHLIKQQPFSSKENTLLKTKQNAIADYLGASTKFLSARYWDHEEAWPGENCFLIDTYYPIIENLTKQCNVKLNTIVNSIDTTESEIKISTDQGEFRADYVIMTVPLGVLKQNRIAFYPSLPDGKRNAIQNLGMGLLNILSLKFPCRFWPKEYDAMFFTEFDTPSIKTFFNLDNFIHQPILIGYYGGNVAIELESLTDQQLIEKTMTNFRKKYGKEIPDPEVYVNTRWLSDPFSYGSYSYLATNAEPRDYNVLAQSIENKLFFAGEATSSRYPATTHGAYLSGIREAENVIQQLTLNAL